MNDEAVTDNTNTPADSPAASSGSWKKIVLGAMVAALLVAYFIWGREHITLENVKRVQAEVGEYYDRNPTATIAAFFALYVIATGLNIPIAAPLTILAGAFFGRSVGTLIVSFAATAGSTLGFLLSRYVLRDFVRSKVGKRIEAFDRGIEKEGAYYLFTLRLIPAVPFWMINLGMGLTALRTPTFWWVSQIGMLPGTFVYVNAGTELGQLESWQGLLSPTLILSFVALGIFPLAVRKLLSLFGRKPSATVEHPDADDTGPSDGNEAP